MQLWVAVVTGHTPLTVASGGEISASLTLSGLGVAILAVAVALAGPALREAPETRLAVGTLLPHCPRDTLTLTGGFVAEGADRAPEVTLTRSAAGGAEQEGGRSTMVTVPAHDVWSTLALTPAGITNGA